MTVTLELPLDIPDIRVLGTDLTATGAMVIKVESTLKTARCHRCGREIEHCHGYDRPVRLRHLPILERQVYLEIRPKRYRCPFCEGGPTSTQRCEWDEPNSPHTKAFERWVLRSLVNSTVLDVSRQLEVGKAAIEGIIDRWLATTVDWSRFSALETLGLDEIALTKGHDNLVTVVSTRDAAGQTAVLAVLPKRLKATVQAFLETIPAPLKATIQRVCTDRHEGYVNAVYAALPGVEVVADRFHVTKHYRDSADQLRQQELKRLQQCLPEADYEPLKGLLWPFRQDWWHLNEAKQSQLTYLFEQAPELQQAYSLRCVLTLIFEANLTKAQALEALNRWGTLVKDSGLHCFDRFLTTLDNWMDEITNYFNHRQSSGFVEGLNNKLKVLKRRCYGVDSAATLFQRLKLDLEGYRLFA